MQIESNDKYEYPYISDFLVVLTLCNNVISEISNIDNKIYYKASSPDELSLVQGAKQCGMQLVGREHDRTTIFNMVTKKHFQYQLICEFPFDSVRKRMSVLVKDVKGSYRLMTKGADSVMLDRINFAKNEIADLRDIVEEDLYHYSCEGLRTLVMAERHVNEQEFNKFMACYNHLKQSNSLDKEERLMQLFDDMEQKMRYLGCTAIEDKLQDGVSVTITRLL